MPSGATSGFPADVALDSALLYVGGVLFGASVGPIRIERDSAYRNISFSGQRAAVAGSDRRTSHALRVTGSFLNFGESHIGAMERNVALVEAPAGVKTWTPKKAGVLFATGEYTPDVTVALRAGDGNITAFEIPKAYIAYAWHGEVDGEALYDLVIEARLVPGGGVSATDKPPFTIRRYMPEDLLAPMLRYEPGDDVEAMDGTFARTSAATYTDVNGVIQTAATGILRDSHYIGAVRTTLIEAHTSTNSFLHSATPSDAYWAVGDMVKSVSPVAAPDGGVATRLTQSGGSNNALSVNVAATVDNWADGIFMRAVPGTGAQWVKMRSQRSDLSQKQCSFDLVNGVVGSTDFAATDVFIEPRGDGWYRIGVKDSPGGGLTHISIFNLKFIHDDNGEPQAGDSTRAWDVWGGQSEPGLRWSSFIYTTTASVVRSADTLILPWDVPADTVFSLLMDHYEIGGKFESEGTRWGIGQVYALDHVMANNIGANYGQSYHREAGAGAGNVIAGAHQALGARLEISFRMKAAAVETEMAVDGGSPSGVNSQGHSGFPTTWGTIGFTVGYHVSGRQHAIALRKLVVLSGDRTFAQLRAG